MIKKFEVFFKNFKINLSNKPIKCVRILKIKIAIWNSIPNAVNELKLSLIHI